MPTCFICNIVTTSIKGLSSHFSLFHSEKVIERYTCCEGNCNRHFSLLNSFKKHLKSHVTPNINKITEIPNMNTESLNIINGEPDEENVDQGNQRHNTSNQISQMTTNNYSSIANLNFQSRLSNFCSKLYSKPQIPRNVVQIVVQELQTLIVDGVSDCANILLTNDEISPESRADVDCIVRVLRNSFEKLNTEHKRLSFFEEIGTFIPPREDEVGEILKEVRKNNISHLVPKVCTEQVIPLRLVLLKFFEMKNVLNDLLQYIDECKVNNFMMRNFIEGSLWQTKKLTHGQDIILPLFMYFDDFEIGNPLGSHSGSHKIGALYVSIPCLPPHYTSLLRNIFVALLFHSQDREKFGNKVVFQPIIDELNYLKTNGIQIRTENFTGVLKFELGLLVGDNLGLHSICGFVESFAANHPCRYCNIHKDILKTQCFDDESLIRTKESHAIDSVDCLVSCSGVKESSVWNDVNGFNVIGQLGVDAMHDLLEGVCKYDMIFIMSYYIFSVKFFSIDTLNERITTFDFGPDSSSKPVPITIENLRKQNLRQSASEMLVLVRYFGLLVGDLVPESNEVWNLYLLLKEILDIILSPIVHRDSCHLLKTLISEHHKLYITLSGTHLKPKFHFLLHYPSLIEKFGPLVNIWSMRYEAKHRISKISAHINSSRRNICKSLAIKHQLQLNNMFLEENLNEVLVYGPSKNVTSALIQSIVKGREDIEIQSAVQVTWIKIKGTRYNINSLLTISISDYFLPAFAFVKKVLVINGNLVLFQCVTCSTLQYDEHFSSYEIECDYKNTIYVGYDELHNNLPNNVNIVGGCRYVTVRGGL